MSTATVLEQMDQITDQMMRETAAEWADYPRGVTPREEIWRAGNVSLLEFDGEEDVSGETPILIIPSLINRWYILDVTEDIFVFGSHLHSSSVIFVLWPMVCT